MKASVQLGLLCLSLIISSLHGEEVETDRSVEVPLNFEEPDLNQLEMRRVRRLAENKDTAVVESLNNNRKMRVRPGSQGPLSMPTPNINHRIKRQEKGKKKKKVRPGMFGLLGTSGVQQPQESV